MHPAYLVGADKTIETTFLGNVHTVYHLSQLDALVPGNYAIKDICLEADGKAALHVKEITGDTAKALRDGVYTKMTIDFE